MAYNKKNWQDNVSDITAAELNRMEQGIYDNSLVTEAITNKLNPTDTTTYKTAELTEGQITDVIGVNDIVIKGQTSQNGEPTPSSPVDVNVVSGSNVIRTADRNLLNVKENTSHGLTSTINPNRSITYKGTIDTTWSNITQASGSSLTAGTYTFSINKTLPYQIRLRGVYQDATYSEANITVGKTSANVTFTQNVVSYYIYIISVTNGTTINETLKAQLEQGSTATTYTNQGKELPLDLPVENLFDEVWENGGINSSNGSNENDGDITRIRTKNYISLKPNTTYTLSFDSTNVADSRSKNSFI